MTSNGFTPDKNSLVRGPELTLDMCFTAVQTLVPAGATIVLDGKLYNQADLLKEIEAQRTPLKDARSAKAAAKKARALTREKAPAVAAFIRTLRAGVRAYLGETNPDIEKFGFKVLGKRRQLTAEENLLRAEKARRTREARHTMGSRQKDSIHGADVEEVVVKKPDPRANGKGSPTPGDGGGTPK